MRDTLWIYQRPGGWFAHIAWANGQYSKLEGPFSSEAQAETVMSRMYGNSDAHTAGETNEQA